MNDFTNMPKSYLLCFNTQCPLNEQCLRHLATETLTNDDTFGPAIYPTALKEGCCRHFRRYRKIPMAWGFSRLFDEVKAKDLSRMRKLLKEYLGGPTRYQRYHEGTYKLTTEQQEWVKKLFEEAGYDTVPQYDHTRVLVDF